MWGSVITVINIRPLFYLPDNYPMLSEIFLTKQMPLFILPGDPLIVGSAPNDVAVSLLFYWPNLMHGQAAVSFPEKIKPL